MKKYVWNLLIAIDQFVNTVFGGDPDETISSRLGKWARDGKLHSSDARLLIYAIINAIVNRFEAKHFEKSIDDTEGQDEVLK